ncbi:MAG: MFS transporter [Flavobacteriales bacterium]|nr:MFS transporter [Flavobacteriales bacterium]
MLKAQKNLSNSFYALLSLPATAMGFALSVQISALSWILSTKYGFDIHEVGIVWAAGPLAGIIAQPIVGAISDNVWFMNGRRRPFILIGGFLAALMLLALPNIDLIGNMFGHDGATLGMAIAIAITLDLSINISFNPTRSIIADVTPEGSKRTNGYTWMQTISGTFGVLAYAIGAYFDNYSLIYFGVILVLVFSLIPPFFIEEPREIKSSNNENSNDKVKSKVNYKEAFDSVLPLSGFLLYGLYVIITQFTHSEVPGNIVEYTAIGITIFLGAKVIISGMNSNTDKTEFQKILLAHAFTWLGVQSMFVYMFAYVKSNIMGFDIDNKLTETDNNQIGAIIAISFLVLNLVGAILPATILGPLSEKVGRVKVHMTSIAIMAAGYAGILFFGDGDKYILYVFMAVVGIGWASTISLPFAIMSERVDQAKMGLFMGLFNLSVVLPQLVASFKMGEVVKNADDKNVLFIITSITLAISAVLWIFVKEPSKQRAIKD